MKRILSILLSIVIVLSLAACGPGMEGDPPSPTENTTPTKPHIEQTQPSVDPTEPTEDEGPRYPMTIAEIWTQNDTLKMKRLKVKDIEELGYTDKGDPTSVNVDGLKRLSSVCTYSDSTGQSVIIQEDDKVVAFGVNENTKEQFIFLLGLHVGMSKSDAMEQLSSFGVDENETRVFLCEDDYTLYIVFDGTAGSAKITSIMVYLTSAAEDIPMKPETDSSHESDAQYKEQFEQTAHQWPQDITVTDTTDLNNSLHLFTLLDNEINIISDNIGKVYGASFNQLQGISQFNIDNLVSTCARTFIKSNDLDAVHVVNDPTTGYILMISTSVKDSEAISATNTIKFCGGLQVGMTTDEAIEINNRNGTVLPLDFASEINIIKSQSATLIIEVKDGLIERITLINNSLCQQSVTETTPTTPDN